MFLCPLCRACRRAVLLEAQLERDEELLVVTELEGCRHADGFGIPVLLTFEEQWQLIEAALDNVERSPLVDRATAPPLRPRPSSN